MPIPRQARNRLLWVGAPASKVTAEKCAERGLSVAHIVPAQCEANWISGRAIVFSRPNASLLKEMSGGLIAEALTQGLRVFVSPLLKDVDAVHQALNRLPYARRAQILAGPVETSIPELVARSDPGPPHSDVQLKGCDGCGTEDRRLLRRAFHDCSEVEFRKLEGGGPRVFQAFAKLRNSAAGPYPLPFFVKLDRYARIARELRAYAECTTHFIPFFARPNLDPDRCLLGANRGLIVGNFVENSHSLAELVPRGTAQTAINSLFEDALRGWRTQAYLSGSGVGVGSLIPEGAIQTFSDKHLSRAERHAQAARSLGGTLSAAEIANLLDALPAIQHRQALCHWDLHGENVRVRGGQAILIDFLNVKPGPLVVDPAALETSLALSLPADPTVWRQVMEDLYSIENLRTLPQVRSPTAPLNELWNAVRQVRRFGLAEQLSRDEYARAVALQLLRHALREKEGEDALRRPTMVLLAERLAQELTTVASTPAAAA